MALTKSEEDFHLEDSMDDGEEEKMSVASATSIAKEKGQERKSSDSSDDENLYDNYLDSYVKRCTNVKKIEDQARAGVSSAMPIKKYRIEDDLESLDSELDDEAEEESILDVMARKAAKFEAERRKKDEEAINRVKDMAVVQEAVLGDLPEGYYPNRATNVTQKAIRQLREAKDYVNSCRSADSSFVEEVVIDARGDETLRRRQIDNGEADDSRNRRVSEIIVTISVLDTHLNKSILDTIEYDCPLIEIFSNAATEWGVGLDQVLASYDGGKAITNLTATPRMLNFPIDCITSISLVMGTASSTDSENSGEAVRDPNMVELCFKMANTRPASFDVPKNSSFSTLLPRIAERFKIQMVSRLIFDSEEMDLSLSPEDLDMEDGDQVDVYA